MTTKHYPALIAVEGQGFYQGHVVYFNGQRAYYRPYDGKDHEAVANEAYATLGELVRERLGYPLASLEEDAGE